MELFLVPCPPFTVTISLFDPELSLGTLNKGDEEGVAFSIPLMGDFVVFVRANFCDFVIADVTADTDDKGAPFGMLFCDLDDIRFVEED